MPIGILLQKACRTQSLKRSAVTLTSPLHQDRRKLPKQTTSLTCGRCSLGTKWNTTTHGFVPVRLVTRKER